MLATFRSWLADRHYFVLVDRMVPSSEGLRVLDIGCGNDTPTVTKRRLPGCHYTGIDYVGKETYSPESQRALDAFHRCDLTRHGLPADLSGPFDLIIMSHVVEHLGNGLDVIGDLCDRLAPGGLLYIEWPAMRSTRFPSMSGCLNFWDDPTHVRLYDLREVANVVMAHGKAVKRLGTRRFKRRIIFSPFVFLYHVLRSGRPRATALWDVLGFAEFILAQAPLPSGKDGGLLDPESGGMCEL